MHRSSCEAQGVRDVRKGLRGTSRSPWSPGSLEGTLGNLEEVQQPFHPWHGWAEMDPLPLLQLPFLGRWNLGLPSYLERTMETLVSTEAGPGDMHHHHDHQDHNQDLNHDRHYHQDEHPDLPGPHSSHNRPDDQDERSTRGSSASFHS